MERGKAHEQIRHSLTERSDSHWTSFCSSCFFSTESERSCPAGFKLRGDPDRAAPVVVPKFESPRRNNCFADWIEGDRTNVSAAAWPPIAFASPGEDVVVGKCNSSNFDKQTAGGQVQLARKGRKGKRIVLVTLSNLRSSLSSSPARALRFCLRARKKDSVRSRLSPGGWNGAEASCFLVVVVVGGGEFGRVEREDPDGGGGVEENDGGLGEGENGRVLRGIGDEDDDDTLLWLCGGAARFVGAYRGDLAPLVVVVVAVEVEVAELFEFQWFTRSGRDANLCGCGDWSHPWAPLLPWPWLCWESVRA